MAYTHDTRDLTPVMTANNAPSPIVVSASSETYSPSYLAWQAFNHTGGNSTYATNTIPSVSVPQWLKIDFGSGNEQYVGAYAISEDTANVNSQPKDWTFEGSSNGTDWVVLDTRSNEVSANWSSGTLRYFNCQKSGLFRYYRINCTANCGATNVYCIAELELFDTRVNLCQTMTSNTAPAPYAAFASSEYSAGYEAYRAVDKSISSKWASSNSSFPHYLAYYFGGDKYIFSGISITGADYPSSATAKASPSTFKIQGSNDNVTYDDLASYSGITNWTENISKYFSCKCYKSYRFIRIYITANDGSSDSIVNIRELKVFGQLKDKCITPVMTSNTAPSPYVVTATNEGGSAAWNAFSRGYTTNKWRTTSGTTSGYIQMYFGSNLNKVSYVEMKCPTDIANVNEAPNAFTIQGSIDTITYTTVGTFTGQTWTAGESKIFPVTTGYYKYLKINVTANNGNGSYLTIGSIFIYGEQYSNLCATMTSNSTPAPYSCSASSEVSASYAAWKAFNKSNAVDTDSWASATSDLTNTWFQYYFGGINYNFKAIVMQGYYNSDQTGSPKNFIIQGSNDGSDVQDLATISNVVWSGGDKKLFLINSNCSYKYLRIKITTTQGDIFAKIGELEIYGTPAKQIVNGYPDVTPAMTAASAPENYAVTATSSASGYDAYKAYEHSIGTYALGWASNGVPTLASPQYNQIKLASPIAFNRIDMINSTDYPMTNPQDFEIYGSIDGSLYTLLAFFQGVIWSSTSQETKTFRFENNTPYSYCKINCLATKPSNIYALEINEVYISREERDDGL